MEPSEYISRQKAIGGAVASAAGRLWGAAGLWEGKLNRAALLVTAGQVKAAQLSDAFIVSQFGSAEFDLVPEAFAGVASDGRPLPSLMRGAAFAAAGKAVEEADAAARAWLWMTVATQIADAARASLRSSMAVWDMSGVRVANLPCCPRCAALAGNVYHWSVGFRRHPGCDCTLAPKRGRQSVAEDDEIPLDQIRGLSKADREAVELGAELHDVVNAQRGMYTAEGGAKATYDSTAHRTSKYPSRAGLGPRLRPESILEQAGRDRGEAVRLLQQYGYIR